MKTTKGIGSSLNFTELRTIKLTITLACIILIPSCYLYGTRTDVVQPIVNLQVSIGEGYDHEVLVVENHGTDNRTEESEILRRGQDLHNDEEANLESQTSNKTTHGTTVEEFKEKKDFEEEQEQDAGLDLQTQNATIHGYTLQDGRIECDFSQIRSDVCEIHGDVRINGPSSSVLLFTSSSPSTPSQNTSFKIRPYTRKWEGPTMELTRELSLSYSTTEHESNSVCSVSHAAPAVIFSTGGFRHNYYHEIGDALIPLFITSYQFQGDVHFLIEDFEPGWIQKYRPVLARLSRHDIVNLDTDKRVHCFSHAIVGLRSNKEMGIDTANTPPGVSMLEFKALLRSSLGLRREFVFKPDISSGKKPRLLFLSRKGSRVLTNEREVLKMVRRLGYKVIVAGPEQTKNLSIIARMVNSCDVMMGVHGAGLTNMIFLPTNATVVQIIPWGEISYPCRFAFGEPATGMGLRYLDYEVNEKETSLRKQYPRDHAVFRDPLSIHKLGFGAIWSIFLHQDVTLDVGRFRGWLSTALNG